MQNDLWRVTLTVEVEANDKDAAIREAMRLDDSVIVSSVINLTARERETASTAERRRVELNWTPEQYVLYGRVFMADRRDEAINTILSLPFDMAASMVHEVTTRDTTILFDPRVMEWCKVNHKAIIAIANAKAANPRGK